VKAPGIATDKLVNTNATDTITVEGEKPVIERGDKSLFIALPPRDLMLRPLTESPGLETATSLVGREEIDRLNAYSVLDAMKYTPGAWTEKRGRKEKQLFSVRGQRYPYPGYLMDGAYFREFTEASYFMNAAFVEQIEITRSSSDLLLTPGGMAGNVNIVPRQYLQPETQFKTEYGSLNTVLTHLSHGDAFKQGSYGVGLGYHHTDGPADKNAEENVGDLYGRILYEATPRLKLSLIGYAMRGERELQLAQPPATLALQRQSENADPMNYYFLVGKARYELDDKAVTEATLNFGNRAYKSHKDGTADQWEKDREYGARLTQGINLSEQNNLRFSGMFNHWESPTGKRYYVGNPGDLQTYAGAIADEHNFGRLALNGGYRFSQSYIKEFGGFNVEGSSTGINTVKVRNQWDDPLHTVSFGGKYQLNDLLSLHGNFTWGQISSQPGMLNSSLQRPDTETRFKYDLGIKATWERFGEISVTGFFVDQHNAPLPQSTSVTVNGVPFVLYENTEAENLGVELDIRSRRFDNGLQGFFNTVAMTTKRVEANNWRRDSEVPQVILGGGVSYLYQRFEATLLTQYVGLYENDRFLPAGTRPVDLGNYTELNAVLNYYFGKQRQHRVYFGADNLTNEKYSTVPGYPSLGVFFKGGVNLRF
jgi:iron complex outermembrane receptor protein